MSGRHPVKIKFWSFLSVVSKDIASVRDMMILRPCTSPVKSFPYHPQTKTRLFISENFNCLSKQSKSHWQTAPKLFKVRRCSKYVLFYVP